MNGGYISTLLISPHSFHHSCRFCVRTFYFIVLYGLQQIWLFSRVKTLEKDIKWPVGFSWILQHVFQFHVFVFFFFFSCAWTATSHGFTVPRTKITIHALFITVHELKDIKNGSHGTIHAFKNYFARVLSVFNFQFSFSATISAIQMDPKKQVLYPINPW